MRPLGPAVRPGAKTKSDTPTQLPKRRKKGWFKKKKTERAEPPVTKVKAPEPVVLDKVQPETAPQKAPKKKSLVAWFAARLGKVEKSAKAKHDPAPSRAKYRWDRLMLRPRSRAAILRGVPALVFLGAVGLLFTNAQLRQDIVSTYTQLRADIVQRPELYVQVMEVKGASPRVDRQIRLSSGLDLPVSSFEMDLNALKDRLERLDAIEAVSVYLRAGGILQVDVTERVPVLLWRGPTGLEAIDLEGVRTAYVDERSSYPGLPIIAGLGAKTEVEEALHLFRQARPLATDIRALKRVGKRRWDLVLTGGTVVKLPQERPGRALSHLLSLVAEDALIDRNITAIDLRDLSRPTIRVGQSTPIDNQVLISTTGDLQTEE